jgi:hypothetical protein
MVGVWPGTVLPKYRQQRTLQYRELRRRLERYQSGGRRRDGGARFCNEADMEVNRVYTIDRTH